MISCKLNSLPLFDTLEEQYHRLPHTFGAVHNLVCPLGYILPFKLKFKAKSSYSLKIELFDIQDKFVADITNHMSDVSYTLRTVGKYTELSNNGDTLISHPFTEGLHYLKISYGLEVLYSEVMAFTNDVSKFLKISYADTNGFTLDDYGDLDFVDGFRYVSYLETNVGKPDYPFEEELVQVDGRKIVEKQISEKVFRFTFIAPEHQCDSLRIVRMCNDVKIESLSKKYCVSYFLITPKWEEQGDLAVVEAEFSEDTIIKKLHNTTDPSCSCDCEECEPTLAFVKFTNGTVCVPRLAFVKFSSLCTPRLAFVKPTSGGSTEVKQMLAMIFEDLDYRNSTVLWSDGSYHGRYFYNDPADTPPSQELTIVDWPHARKTIDRWVAKGGNSVQLPIFWDRSQYGANSYEFRPYIWLLQYAASKGVTVGFWLLPFRRFAGAEYPAYNTTTSWSFEAADREIDSNGVVWGDTFNQCLALASPKWNNVYTWAGKVAEALSPYVSTIEYMTLGTNPTYETSFQMERLDANHPNTVSAWQQWHLDKYGETAPAMANRDEVTVSLNKIRTAKFHSFIYSNHNTNVCNAIKAKMPDVKYIWHGGSMTDDTFLRGCFDVMANLNSSFSGVKHNPNGNWDAKFEVRAISKGSNFTVIEWTRDAGLPTPAIFAQKIMESIDAGVHGISWSFFDGIYQDTVIEQYTDEVIQILRTNGYWGIGVKGLANNNNEVIQFKTSEVAAVVSNKYLDYRSIYTPAFNASVNAHSGNPPQIEWIDDVNDTN